MCELWIWNQETPFLTLWGFLRGFFIVLWSFQIPLPPICPAYMKSYIFITHLLNKWIFLVSRIFFLIWSLKGNLWVWIKLPLFSSWDRYGRSTWKSYFCKLAGWKACRARQHSDPLSWNSTFLPLWANVPLDLEANNGGLKSQQVGNWDGGCGALFWGSWPWEAGKERVGSQWGSALEGFACFCVAGLLWRWVMSPMTCSFPNHTCAFLTGLLTD